MFPPPSSTTSILPDDSNPFTRAYQHVIIYDEADTDDALYEGPIIVHANGWIELEGNRLLSPSAIHHIDVYDDELAEFEQPDERPDNGDERGGDSYRTNRFSPY